MSESNDKTQNTTLYDELGNEVGVILDGSIYRLQVEAQLTADTSFQLQAFNPKSDFDSTGISLNTSTWDTLLEITTTRGKLDFIAMSGASSQYEVRITVDSVVFVTIGMPDLSAIGLSNATNVEMWAETADKNFRYSPNDPVDFVDNLKIEVRALTATPNLKHLILYREEA